MDKKPFVKNLLNSFGFKDSAASLELSEKTDPTKNLELMEKKSFMPKDGLSTHIYEDVSMYKGECKNGHRDGKGVIDDGQWIARLNIVLITKSITFG